MASNSRPSPVKRSVSFQHSPLPDTNSSSQQHTPDGALEHAQRPAAAHKPHRPHLVGTHRSSHGRNLSHKSLNKLQRLALTHNLAAESPGLPSPTTPKHQRKKSAPASPATSPRVGSGPHVRWNSSVVALGGQAANPAVKRNLSTPILKRNASGGLVVKKNQGLLPAKNQQKPERKKSVGFELADSSEEDEWEDNSSRSASSTRRNSLTGKMNGDVHHHQHSGSIKSPLAQEDRVIDSPKPRGEVEVQPPRSPTHDDIASRILLRPHVSKAPPAISSISATAKPAVTERSPSFVNLSSSLAHGGLQSPFIPTNAHGTSSSVEGGVSRFLTNEPGAQSASGPSAPSSLLPHYHPESPPSPEASPRRPKSPTSSRRRPPEPASRTQQKLWLQRNAALSTSPPDPVLGGLGTAINPAARNYVPDRRGPTSGIYGHDGRGVAASASAGSAPDSDARRARKLYDKLSSELSVVQRFRGPSTDSFNRLQKFLGSDSHDSSLHSHSSHHAQTNGHRSTSTAAAAASDTYSRPASRMRDSDTGPSSQFLAKPSTTSNGSSQQQPRFQDQYYIVNVGDTEQHAAEHADPSGVAVVTPDGNIDDQLEEASEQGYSNGSGRDYRLYRPNEEQMLLRRMWESREVAVEGD